MEAESNPIAIKSNSTSVIFKADVKILPVPISGTVGIMHNYTLLIFSSNRRGSELGHAKDLPAQCPISDSCQMEMPREDMGYFPSVFFQLPVISAVQRVPDPNLVSACLVTFNAFIFHEFLAMVP